jgi:hypothetical protein
LTNLGLLWYNQNLPILEVSVMLGVATSTAKMSQIKKLRGRFAQDGKTIYH